jgi:UDP-glucose 4-epimerase
VKVVVTGASGFVGSFVKEKLEDVNVRPILVSRRKILGYQSVANYTDTPLGDVLIHLAECNNRFRVNQSPVEYEREALRVLHSLLRKGYRKVIYASSSVIYGNSDCAPHIESERVSAVDAYTRVKLASEQAVLASGGIVVRLGNIYGPGMSAENVFSHILGQLNLRGAVTLQDTSPIRDFIWVEDVAEVIVKMAMQQTQGLFNVGTGIGTSVGELARIFLAEAKQSHRKIVSTQSEAEPSCIVLDITKTQEYFHWHPSVLLNEGIRRLIRSHKGMNHI